MDENSVCLFTGIVYNAIGCALKFFPMRSAMIVTLKIDGNVNDIVVTMTSENDDHIVSEAHIQCNGFASCLVKVRDASTGAFVTKDTIDGVIADMIQAMPNKCGVAMPQNILELFNNFNQSTWDEYQAMTKRKINGVLVAMISSGSNDAVFEFAAKKI